MPSRQQTLSLRDAAVDSDACVDLDNDGHCALVDCEDRVFGVNPGVEEIDVDGRCTNAFDDDCDGKKNEEELACQNLAATKQQVLIYSQSSKS